MEVLQDGLRDILEQNLFYDVEIHFKNGERLYLHQLILASCSSLLKKCFQDLQNSSEETLSIILPDYFLSDFR